eukprot:4459498-Ditylum_brightwellii.AAC.2
MSGHIFSVQLKWRRGHFPPYKHGGLCALAPCHKIALNREASILGFTNFKQDVHQVTIETGRASGVGRKEEAYKEVRGMVEEEYIGNQKQGLDCVSKSLNHWISVVPCMANNTVLGKDEFRDIISYRYKITPKDLPAICNGCGKQHSLQHVLQCKSDGLILGCQDDAHDDLGHVSTQACSPSSIRNDPKIKSSQKDKSRKDCRGDTTTKTGKDTVHIHNKCSKDKDPGLYGDLLIWRLWKCQTDCIINICITDTDANSYISHSVESVLAAQEKEKKAKYFQACLEQ